MRPPKRPSPGADGAPLEEALRALRSRAAFGAGWEFEALEAAGHAVFVTRFRKPVFEMLKEWEAAYPGYRVEDPAAAPDGKTLALLRARRGEAAWEFYSCGAQAYTAGPLASARGLLARPHDFIPEELRSTPAYRAVAVRVHLAGGSDQWVSRSKLEKFLASGRDGPLTGLDWGQLPE